MDNINPNYGFEGVTMLLEHFILIAMWLFGFAGLFLFIPRKNRREGILALLMFQSIIWLCDMPTFKYELLSAPVRVFPKTTDLTVTINYIFYPTLFAIYYVHQRKNGNTWFMWTTFTAWVLVITLFDILIERYTELLTYGRMTWYWMLLYIAFLFFVSHAFCNWFYHHQSMTQPAVDDQ
ncbi:CBO0543 family protein [Bacillus sp. REN16]|uniref:CBO0543 family protein n=1 Tax=Bacillus sp. REN16 TaxID=2887296 RepID=UPI001E48E4E5|nr:CBO0543 family protein [Bacillus sp. REN16]MCC3356120.1 hypothetical protein [Bacillus sp. REN16]